MSEFELLTVALLVVFIFPPLLAAQYTIEFVIGMNKAFPSLLVFLGGVLFFFIKD